MESPSKFLDSYTKDDREIFFGRDREIEELTNIMFQSISPLQGLNGILCSYSHWTMSNAMILCAFSAILWRISSALKGQHNIKQDSVLLGTLTMLISPEGL